MSNEALVPAEKKKRAKKGNGEGSVCYVSKKIALADGTIKEHKYWEVKITTTDERTGKKVRKSFCGKTKREALAKRDKAIAEIANEGFIFEPSTLSLSKWADEWIDMLEGKVSYNTLKTYKSRCETHIKPALGDIKITMLQKIQVQKFVDKLSKTHSPKTVRNIHGVLVKCLEDAVEYELIKHNPANGVRLPSVVRGENAKEVTALTEEQIKEFLRIAESRKHSTLIKVILFTGLRESEALGLTWDCIDFERNTITVKQQLQYQEGNYVLVKSTKSKKARVLKVAPYVMSLLKEVRVSQMKDKLRAGEMWQGWKNSKEQATALVFTNELGRYIIHENLYNCVKRIFATMGIPEHSVHDLRHEFAILSLQNGDDIKTVQSNLGHATASFTLDVYGHVSEKMKDESANRMQAYIEAVS